jgi:hypothetical protein
MFCPNCGAKNSVEQNYCRGCGLKLDAVVEAVSYQFPSEEYAGLQRRKERFEWIGLLCLSIAGIIGFSLLLFLAVVFKLIFFGAAEVLIVSAVGALITFLLLAVFFFYYPKLFMKGKTRPNEEIKVPIVNTAKLIEDRPIEPVPSSVTEGTTDLLKVPARNKD